MQLLKIIIQLHGEREIALFYKLESFKSTWSVGSI